MTIKKILLSVATSKFFYVNYANSALEISFLATMKWGQCMEGDLM